MQYKINLRGKDFAKLLECFLNNSVVLIHQERWDWLGPSQVLISKQWNLQNLDGIVRNNFVNN